MWHELGTVFEQAEMPIGNCLSDSLVLARGYNRPWRGIIPVWVPEQNDPTLIEERSALISSGIYCCPVIVTHFVPPEC